MITADILPARQCLREVGFHSVQLPPCLNDLRVENSVLIFVVEDDDLVCELLLDALHDGGYEVATANNGEDAIALLDAADADYRALITDVNLTPGKLTGWDVAKHARELMPELPVVYMTGMAGNEWASKGVPNSLLLTKPFAPAQALTAVSHLLNKLSFAPGE